MNVLIVYTFLFTRWVHGDVTASAASWTVDPDKLTQEEQAHTPGPQGFSTEHWEAAVALAWDTAMSAYNQACYAAGLQPECASEHVAEMRAHLEPRLVQATHQVESSVLPHVKRVQKIVSDARESRDPVVLGAMQSVVAVAVYPFYRLCLWMVRLLFHLLTCGCCRARHGGKSQDERPTTATPTRSDFDAMAQALAEAAAHASAAAGNGCGHIEDSTAAAPTSIRRTRATTPPPRANSKSIQPAQGPTAVRYDLRQRFGGA